MTDLEWVRTSDVKVEPIEWLWYPYLPRGEIVIWNQAELAKKAGLRRATISDIENGKTNGIDFDTLEKLADALEVETTDLIVRTGNRRWGK